MDIKSMLKIVKEQCHLQLHWNRSSLISVIRSRSLLIWTIKKSEMCGLRLRRRHPPRHPRRVRIFLHRPFRARQLILTLKLHVKRF